MYSTRYIADADERTHNRMNRIKKKKLLEGGQLIVCGSINAACPVHIHICHCKT